jgi:hypothetical protein
VTQKDAGVLGSRLGLARDRAFVGRVQELAIFRSALAGETGAPPVQFLHGPGGIGKSMLLRRMSLEARRAGRVVVEVDGRTVEPTPEGFARAAAGVFADADAVLTVDTFERCQGLEGWLWEKFLPSLPLGTVVVIAGRQAPNSEWTSDPGWYDLLHVSAMRNLPPRDAVALLTSRGVPQEVHERLLSFTGGHPLALALAAAADGAAGTEASWLPGHGVVDTLLPRLIDNPPSGAHRRALEICAHAYVTSESLLAALVGEQADELFAWLRGQPFVESTAMGLFPHDVVRETLEADLRWRDPEGFAVLHRDLRDHLFQRLRCASDAGLLSAIGALLYLYRTDSSMSEFHTWGDVGAVYERPYNAGDQEGVLALAREAEGDRSAELVRYWSRQQPGAFRVYCSAQTDQVVAFGAWLRLDDVTGVDTDPVVAEAWEHLRSRAPLREGEYLALARFSVHPPAYHRPSAAMTLIQWRAMAELLRADKLAWHFLVFRDDGFWDGHLGHFDMLPTAKAVRVGDHDYRLFGHDWRVEPPRAWLEAKSTVMLSGGAAASPETTRAQPELVVLSRPEFEAAVRDALRTLRQPKALAENPLSRSRIAVSHDGDLREVLTAAAALLLQDNRNGEKQHRAVVTTYLKAAPTQEAAAERLGLPFSTYRRHLTGGTEAIVDILWQHELTGAALAPARAGTV